MSNYEMGLDCYEILMGSYNMSKQKIEIGEREKGEETRFCLGNR